jgi:hypothetical protein
LQGAVSDEDQAWFLNGKKEKHRKSQGGFKIEDSDVGLVH